MFVGKGRCLFKKKTSVVSHMFFSVPPHFRCKVKIETMVKVKSLEGGEGHSAVRSK